MGKRHNWDYENLQMSRKVSEILYREIANSRKHIAQVAKEIGLSEWNLYKYTDPDSASNNIPAFLIPRLTKAIGKGLLEFIAWESGYFLVPIPECKKPADTHALELLSKEAKEHAEAIEAFTEAMKDGKVSEEEFQKIKKEVNEAIQVLLEFIAVARIICEKAKEEV